jgi:hypothetical protein
MASPKVVLEGPHQQHHGVVDLERTLKRIGNTTSPSAFL